MPPGGEGAIAARYGELDRIQTAEHFWPFLLWGKTAAGWDWRDRGLVLFLGGDQIFPVVVGKRLGYATVVYAEWEARWGRWIDGFGVRRGEDRDRLPARYQSKCTVVGDLMVDTSIAATSPPLVLDPPLDPDPLLNPDPKPELIGLLAGSKAAKLTQGVPFMVIIAEELQRQRPQVRCFIPLAPNLSPERLLEYAQAAHNPMVKILGSPATSLVELPGSGLPDSGPPDFGPDTQPGQDPANSSATANRRTYLKTAQGAWVELYRAFPAYDRLAQCDLCLTTIGANTAELGALAVPMIVLLPTQQLDAMRAWNGLPGLLANLPGLGSLFAKAINGYMLGRLGLLAWPNIWAGEEIVPELVGELDPRAIARQVLDYLDHPERLRAMGDRLKQVRGEPGAAQRLTDVVVDQLNLNSSNRPAA